LRRTPCGEYPRAAGPTPAQGHIAHYQWSGVGSVINKPAYYQWSGVGSVINKPA
jgi:hypothetical protein